MSTATFDFKRHRALVTGGTRGIGMAIAQALLSSGCEVAITGFSADGGWWNNVPNCKYYRVDFGKEEEVSEFLQKHLQDEHFDLLVNCAGTFSSQGIGDLSSEEWNHVVNINLTIPFRVIQALQGKMSSSRYGRIVNIGSIAAILSRAGSSAYAVSKAGLVSLTKTAAIELSNCNILVNCVCPGYTDTDMMKKLSQEKKQVLLENVPLGRFGTPEEIAPFVLFLLSDANSYITGQTFVIDGGVTIQQ